MLLRLVPLFLAATLCCIGTACKRKTTAAEKKAEEIRRFRDQQGNLARKCYQDITTKYPDSEFAERAAERVKALGTPTPQKK